MKHLSPEVLGALLDRALDDPRRRDAERHLESCAECRAKRAALAAQDELTARSLEHDPGEAYFDNFAARVSGVFESMARPQRRRRARCRGGSCWGRRVGWPWRGAPRPLWSPDRKSVV